jgi:hypothetical protein
MSHNLDQGVHGWRKSSFSAGREECVEAGLLPAGVRWQKSSYSAGRNECVETGLLPADTADAIAVRDTKANGTGPVLAFPAASWTAFIGAVKAGGVFAAGLE